MKGETIQIYNSSTDGSEQENLDLEHLLTYLQDEHKQRKDGTSLPDVDKWKLIKTQLSTTPMQGNRMFSVLYLFNQIDSLL